MRTKTLIHTMILLLFILSNCGALRAEPGTLAEKAAYYDGIAARLHVHPDLKWIMPVTLPCAPGDCARTAVPQETATWRDVERWSTGENDGLWSALYMASQAYRYAATRDPAALDMLRTLLDGEVTRMRITGVSGIFTRQFIPPGVPGIACPSEPEAFYPDVEKDDNKWVRVGDSGCVQTVDSATNQWKTSTHCGLDAYRGWCWLDNVSKDEYSGNVFALGTVAALVDDPQILEATRGLLSEIARHLMKNGMEFVDWDGRRCEHGPIHAVTFGDYPGFNAAMALSFIKTAAFATGDPAFDNYYKNCLLQQSGKKACLKKTFETPAPYTDYLDRAGLYPGFEACKANYNNTSMHLLSLHNLLWFETDPVLLAAYRDHLENDVMRAPGQPRAVIYQNNAFFDFIYAARMGAGAETAGAVSSGIEMLRQFPARKNQRAARCPDDKCAPYCEDRFGNPTGNYARPIAERCLSAFTWWGDPYNPRECAENQRFIFPPTDYLLAYWMGRYYGFISEDM